MQINSSTKKLVFLLFVFGFMFVGLSTFFFSTIYADGTSAPYSQEDSSNPEGYGDGVGNDLSDLPEEEVGDLEEGLGIGEIPNEDEVVDQPQIGPSDDEEETQEDIYDESVLSELVLYYVTRNEERFRVNAGESFEIMPGDDIRISGSIPKYTKFLIYFGDDSYQVEGDCEGWWSLNPQMPSVEVGDEIIVSVCQGECEAQRLLVRFVVVADYTVNDASVSDRLDLLSNEESSSLFWGFGIVAAVLVLGIVILLVFLSKLKSDGVSRAN